MKKLLTLLCAILLAACSSREMPVRLTSTVEDGTVSSVSYTPLTANFDPMGSNMTPAAKRGDGFAIPDDGQVYVLTVLYNNRLDQLRFVVLMPGEHITLSGRLNIGTNTPDVRFSGTELYDTLYRELAEMELATKHMNALIRRVNAGETLLPEELHALDSLNRWATNYTKDHVRNHPESPTAAYYLLTRIIPDSCYTDLYYGIPEEVRSGKYKPIYDIIRPEARK